MSNLRDGISLEDVERGDFNVGWRLLIINDWWEARSTFLNARDNGICDANTLAGLGISHYKTGETNTGLNYLFEAFEIDQSPEIRFSLAAVLAEDSRFEESLKLLEGITWSEDEKPLAAEVEAICLIHSDRIQEAIPFLEIVSNMSGRYAAGHLNLGLGLAYIGKIEDALAKVQSALNIHKQYGEDLRPMGLDGPQFKATEALVDLLTASKGGQ
jgi:tetratricopeptide (TPR) repeat protein